MVLVQVERSFFVIVIALLVTAMVVLVLVKRRISSSSKYVDGKFHYSDDQLSQNRSFTPLVSHDLKGNDVSFHGYRSKGSVIRPPSIMPKEAGIASISSSLSPSELMRVARKSFLRFPQFTCRLPRTDKSVDNPPDGPMRNLDKLVGSLIPIAHISPTVTRSRKKRKSVGESNNRDGKPDDDWLDSFTDGEREIPALESGRQASSVLITEVGEEDDVMIIDSSRLISPAPGVEISKPALVGTFRGGGIVLAGVGGMPSQDRILDTSGNAPKATTGQGGADCPNLESELDTLSKQLLVECLSSLNLTV
ncbi:hypothetical protein J5N97_009586 [Dioscorea zingiberensis]|uniref:Uncharacterized protein n=1 Tax=Dioscorea zingiberensis TaxID=325984 RepID=A0A9D5HM25_9LILI|nr:hypothetical protein J5N97_009586 [Dioscorea zingiberensis]